MSCERLTEEDVAAALSPDFGACDEIRDAIPRWMSRCCEACSGKLHRVLRIQELMGLAGVRDPYEAWQRVDEASRRRGEPAEEIERVATAVSLLMAEERLRFESPPEGLANAERACELVAGLEGECPVRYLADAESRRLPSVPARRPGLLALVQARYGNALRYGSQLADGLMWTWRAVLIVRSVEVAPFVHAEVHSLAASAQLDSGQLRQALETIRESIASYASLGDVHRAGVEKIQLAEILFQSGEPVTAVLDVLEAAVSEIDRLRAPVLHCGCRLNVAYYQLKAHRPLAAEEVAEEVLKDTPSNANQTIELKWLGLHALVHLAKGKYTEAAENLRDVVDSFLEIGMSYDAAIFLLYRGEAMIRRGTLESGRQEIERAYELFRRLDAAEAMKQTFAQLIHLVRRATADEMIAGIRRQAELMGGCLPRIERSPDYPETPG